MPIVIPNMASLAGLSGQSYSINAPALTAGMGPGNAAETGRAASASVGGGLTITAGSGSGIWVPYAAGKMTYGYAGPGTTWMGTGPFSGCHIAFFLNKGRLGLAHIAKDSAGSGATEAWERFRKGTGISVLNEWKIGLPDQTRYSASNVFLDLSDPKSVALARVDVHVRTMGGEEGTIFAVHKVL